MRTAPGQTNLYPTNAADPQGFYGVGVPSSAGNDFWLTIPTLYSGSGEQLIIYISSQMTNSVILSIPGLGFTHNFTLAPASVTNISLPIAAIISTNGSPSENGIHVTATQPVSVYILYLLPTASTAFTAYQTRMLGTNYCVLARPSYVAGRSEFAIVGTVNNTSVAITPSATANLLGFNGVTVTNITLQQGQTYQLQSTTTSNDVTGTLITSDNPIAVFAGASDTFAPNASTGYGNPIAGEQLPIAEWGNQALSLSFGRPGGDIYRVLAVSNNTVVTNLTTNTLVAFSPNNAPIETNAITNGVFVVTLANAGQFYEAIMDGPVQFQANNPIQVAQISQGLVTDGGSGDPCEIMLPSTGNYLNSYVIATAPESDFTNNFVNLIVAQSGISTTLLDGIAVATNAFTRVGGSGYAAARFSVTAGTNHTVSSSQPIEVEVYGFGNADAYGYIGGISFP
jgi:hypothetical protein